MNTDRLIFLPGTGGAGSFWTPVAELLAEYNDKVLIDWPGLGDSPIPADASVGSFEDLSKLVLEHVDRPVALIAQSMGGVVALMTALARPGLVTKLVLTATSGGIDMSLIRADDWRPNFIKQFAQAPGWVTQDRQDLTSRLPGVTAPTLLISGDLDPISPIPIAELLASMLPNAEVAIVKGGDHSVAHDQPRLVATSY